MKGTLPPSVEHFIQAHQEMVGGLHSELSDTRILKFSLDGKLLGDLGEWLAARHFGVEIDGKNSKGFDGWLGDKKVEVKTTLRGDGVVFRYLERQDRPDHLIVFLLSRDGKTFDTVYNGSHDHAVERLYERWSSGKPAKTTQCSISLEELRERQRSEL